MKEMRERLIDFLVENKIEIERDKAFVFADKLVKGGVILDPSEIAALKAKNAELRENIKIKQQEYVEQVKINKAHINNAIEDGKRIKAAEKRARVLERALEMLAINIKGSCTFCRYNDLKTGCPTNKNRADCDRFQINKAIQQAQIEIDKEGV